MNFIRRIFFLVFFSRIFVSNVFAQTANIVFNNTVNSVVTVVTDKSIGSGFFISANLVATNYHVIEDASNAVIYLNSTSIPYQVKGYVAKDEINDLVILEVSYTSGVPIKMAIESVGQGDDILVIGSPRGIPATISKGIVSNLNAQNKLIQIDASISHGSSGGPVLNMKGEVIGVAVASIEDGQNLNFAVPIKLLENLLNSKINYSIGLNNEKKQPIENNKDYSESKNMALVTFNDGRIIFNNEFLDWYDRSKKQRTRDELQNYLRLLINYELKIKQAEQLKLDKTDSFNKELSKYAEELKTGFKYDNLALEELLREAYENLKKEVRASHVLIKCEKNAGSKDTLEAYKKAIKIRNELIQGADFRSCALKYSDDPSAKENGGDLGYFTTLQMVYPFETAVFSMKIGDVSMPVRTRFGYHIIKLNNIRASLGELKVAHIMVKTKANSELEDSLNSVKKINDIYLKLKGGGKFEELASRFSEDQSSAKSGGTLPVFGTGRMEAEFENAAFALAYPGDYSKPIKTKFGWHIIKLLEIRELGSYEVLKKDLKGKVLVDSRSDNLKKLNDSEIEALPEYRSLLYEYRNGILLFEITDKTVWSKAVKDTVGLRSYYNQNRSNYNNKKFETVSKQVIVDYQTYLEQEWIEELRSEFPYIINQKVLNEMLDSY